MEGVTNIDISELNLSVVTLYKDAKTDVPDAKRNGRPTTSIAGCLLLLWGCFTLFLSIFDLSTDSIVAKVHIRNGNIYWGVMTITFIILPIIVNFVREVYEAIKYGDGSAIVKAICIAPIRSFYIQVNNIIANIRGEHITVNAYRVIGFID